jgi:hypothetical protein
MRTMDIQLKKFTPGRAVKILQSRKGPPIHKTLALAALMSWMMLDQKKHKVGRDKPVFRRRHALLARNIVIFSLLKRRKGHALLFEMLTVFLTSDGVNAFLNSPRSPRGWLSRLRKDKEISCVYQITSYLCRYREYGQDPKKSGVQYAKAFVEKARNTDVTRRTLAKYWETNKQAAPYIFAFYVSLRDAVRRVNSIHEMVDLFAKLSADQELMDRLLGNAAHMADLLGELHVRRVRTKDFKSVVCVRPNLTPFDDDELEAIAKIDLYAGEDLSNYKARGIPRRATEPSKMSS